MILNKYDLVMVHKVVSQMTDDDVLGMLKGLFPERNLYRVSIDWRKDKKFILKARGTRGDVIVGWVENQSCNQSRLTHCPVL